MSLETDSYTRRRAPLRFHPSSRRTVSVLLPSHPFCVGLSLLRWAEALLFPFIVYYEWYVTRRRARPRKRRARRCRRGFFFLLSRRSPSSFLRAFSFCGTAAVEKSKIQVEDVGDQLIDIVSQYCTYVSLLISFHFGYGIFY